MKIHPVITQQNGIISVVLQASFVGDSTDASDKAKIQALGDPEVNIAGTFQDPNDTSATPFTFQFPATEMYVGITLSLQNYTAQFMTALPPAPGPNTAVPVQGPLQVITPDPTRAAQVWYTVMSAAGPSSRIGQAMQNLRAQSLVPTLSDTTI
jgi:hypothetical protein